MILAQENNGIIYVVQLEAGTRKGVGWFEFETEADAEAAFPNSILFDDNNQPPA